MSFNFIGLSQDDDKVLDPPFKVKNPWVIWIVIISAFIQCIAYGVVLLVYALNKKFREKPGNIIFGFALSAFFLPIFWAVNLFKVVEESPWCSVIGFFALFAEHNCIFYEIGILYYFACYLKHITKPFLITDYEHSHPQGFNIQQNFTSQIDLADRINVKKISDAHARNYISILEDKVNILEQNLNTASKKLNQTLTDYEREKDELLNLAKNNYDSALNVQGPINCCVLIISFALTLVSAITKELGLDFYGACSKIWKGEIQSSGIMLTVLISAISTLASGLAIIYFRKLKKTFIRQNNNYIDADHQDLLERTQKLNDEQNHYLRHLYVYTVVVTLIGWLFSGTNIYADRVEDPTPSSINYVLFVIHFLMLAGQGISILVLKLSEPLTKRAIEETFRSIFA